MNKKDYINKKIICIKKEKVFVYKTIAFDLKRFHWIKTKKIALNR